MFVEQTHLLNKTEDKYGVKENRAPNLEEMGHYPVNVKPTIYNDGLDLRASDASGVSKNTDGFYDAHREVLALKKEMEN